MRTSRSSLILLAAAVWYVGAVALLLKAADLVSDARLLRPGAAWTWAAVAAGVVAGGIKAVLLFRRACRRNLARIHALEDPRTWQFYRPGFFLALALMISLGAGLSRLAQGSYPFVLAVAALDLSIGTALLASSDVFWERRTP